ncbi:hypothetical protein Leryth_012084 [Lithospermum erythrorhizon]|nr:hypothetical protein Leryth_012084 [Lithospermum erythrorhizon]
MGSNGADDVSISGNNEAKTSETMVEIKIKTLDSQTHTLRVDKYVPVPALKDQIATVTGILSEQQRLICRGKVLKDDQLLSAYHVEDGHTLHLVVRQPIAPLGENASDNPGFYGYSEDQFNFRFLIVHIELFYNNPAADPASSSEHNEGGGARRSVLVGSFNLSEQGDGIPDIGRILSAVLGSIGINSTGNGGEEITFNESAAERAYSISGGQQPDQTGTRDQPTPNTTSASYPNSDPLQPQVIPDSLTTLTQYLRHLRHECDTNVRGQNNSSQTAGTHGVGAQDFHAAGTGLGGLPTPASMAEVLMSTRQLLSEQIEECLLQVATYMENQTNVTDPAERSRIQAYAFRSGRLVQNLGALFLELGRSMMTLQMGPTPADAVINAGPALFVSMTGPNPIMVQPLPFLPGTSFGAAPVGTSQQSSGFGVGSVGSGFVPRNIDIRIRSAVGRRDPTSSPQTIPPNINNTPAHGITSEGAGHSSTRDPEVRVVPIRSVYASVPTAIGPAASDSTHGSIGMIYPVLARVHHVTPGNPTVPRSSQVPGQHTQIVFNGRSSMPNPAAQLPNTGLPDPDGSNISVDGIPSVQGTPSQVHDGLNQLLRTIFSDVNNPQEAALRPSDDGVLLSNILHQIMPLISESIGTTSNVSSAYGENASVDSTQVPESSEQASSSQHQQDPLSSPNPKRQKRE